jgi:hypothetical protein
VRAHLHLTGAIAEDQLFPAAGRVHRIDLAPADGRGQVAVLVHHLDHHPLVVRPEEAADGGLAFWPEEEDGLTRGHPQEGERALSALVRQHRHVGALGRDLRRLHLRELRVHGDPGRRRFGGGSPARSGVLAGNGQRGERDQRGADRHGGRSPQGE